MKVLFVVGETGYSDNIAIACLSAIAKQLNHSTFFCTLDKDDLSEKIKAIKPDVVGYSVNVFSYRNIVSEHKKAREKYNFISIMGGPYPTSAPETFNESGMDAYCIGEGEYVFKDFLMRVEKNKKFDDVSNLITKKGNNPVRHLIENLDELPMPDRDLMFENTFLKDISKRTFFASRGCPFSCSYCCNNHYNKMYKGKGSIVRRFSVKRLIREIEEVKSKYKMDFVKFDDDCFILKADSWLEEFAEKYPKRVGVPFNCLLRYDVLDDKILSLLKKAGCHSIHLSADSTSKYVREVVLKRKTKKDNLAELIKKIKSYGIYTYVNFMVAIPESTVFDDLNSIFFSRRAAITYPAYTITRPLVGTDLYDYCMEKGYLNEDYFDKMNDPESVGFLPSYDTSSLSCFSNLSKNIRQNIAMLGAIFAKIPSPLDKLFLPFLLFPPNKYYVKLWEFFHSYYMKNKVYILEK